MAQYQSFPDASGDSRTLDKLKALKLPDLSGLSFLDIGCNEGFFCGYAKYQGATRSVGLDQSALFIERARARFQACEFHRQTWDQLPDGTFDVILLASALHYADDQAALLHRLVEKLSPKGVLVLELGIVSSPRSEWVRVQRGIDERDFPTMLKLRELLAEYAWKWMGPSVAQDGDPVARHVVHISRKRPMAYLLLQPPAYGKSSIAAGLFKPAGITVVSGDEQIRLIAQGKLDAPAGLRQVIVEEYSPFRIDQVTQRIFRDDLGNDLAKVWSDLAGGADFALEAYVPAEHQASIEAAFAAIGYFPVRLTWERPGLVPLPTDRYEEATDAFYLSLGVEAGGGRATPATGRGLVGTVDEVALVGGQLQVRGWAVAADGYLPRRLTVALPSGEVEVKDFQKQLRPDVQSHLGLPHALYGYRFSIPAPQVSALSELHGFAIRGDDTSPPFRLSAPLAKLLPSQDE